MFKIMEKEKLLPFAIVAIISIGVIGLFVMSSGNAGSGDYSQGALSITEDYFDFATVSMGDGKVTHDFEIRNDSEENVVIEKVFTSCMCTSATVTTSAGRKYGIFGMQGHGGPTGTSVEVAPGESVVVEAIFDPAAHGPSGVGLAKRSIYLETNSAKSPKLEVSFQAMVTR